MVPLESGSGNGQIGESTGTNAERWHTEACSQNDTRERVTNLPDHGLRHDGLAGASAPLPRLCV
jgi:hypothetical protein